MYVHHWIFHLIQGPAKLVIWVFGFEEMGGPGNSALDNHEGDLRRDSVQSGGRDLEVISPDNLEYRVLFFISIFETIVYI